MAAASRLLRVPEYQYIPVSGHMQPKLIHSCRPLAHVFAMYMMNGAVLYGKPVANRDATGLLWPTCFGLGTHLSGRKFV